MEHITPASPIHSLLLHALEVSRSVSGSSLDDCKETVNLIFSMLRAKSKTNSVSTVSTDALNSETDQVQRDA
jgi:hypothetical protein